MRLVKMLCIAASAFCFFMPLQGWASAFTKAMGEGTSIWDYVETREDRENLSFYSSLFDAQFVPENTSVLSDKIPRLIHFIWLGPKELSDQAIDNMSVWIAKHPDWKVKLWTDRDRQVTLDGIEVVQFKQYPFEELSHEYYEADNYGEKSQILKYAALLHEGGLYVDHDVHCLQAFTTLIQKYDFFAGLEPLGATYLSSTVTPSTSVIGSRPFHPILIDAMQWLKSNWASLSVSYPGSRQEHIESRVKHRSFSALEQGIKKSAGLSNNKDIVFPSTYFGGKSKENAVFATHAHLGTWHKKVYPLEKKLERYSLEIKKKNDLLDILIYVVSAIQVVIITLLAIFWVSMKKSEGRKL